MGCGASTANEQKSVQGKPVASSHSTSTAYVHQVQADLSDDDDVPMTEEQIKLIEEIDARTAASTAESASEPGDFKISVRIGIRCAKARLFHGIDGSCDAGLPKEIEASTPKGRAAAAAATTSEQYGELKPRQIRKIQEWVDRVRLSSNGRHSPVPERYGSKSNLRIDVSDTSYHASNDGMMSPMRDLSTPRSQADFTPRSDFPNVSEWNSRQNTPGFHYTDVDDDLEAGHTPRLGRLPEAE